MTADSLDSATIQDYAVTLARSLLLSKEGKAAGYWTKPLIGKPRVTGSAYVIGTYTSFILGCPLAGLRRQPTEEPPPLLPEAESLVAYFLEYPTIKAIMDAHFRSVDEYAAKNLSPEMVGAMGDLRETLSRSGGGRGDESILTVYWQIMQQGPAITIQQGIDAFASLFLYGTCLSPSEVKRLWGIQAGSAVVPLMERPLEDVQSETVAEINGLGQPGQR